MPFKDTPDGQTYFDPEAERKAREPMQDLIKESASEFAELIKKEFPHGNNWNYCFYDDDLKSVVIDGSGYNLQQFIDWHTKQMEKAYNKGRIASYEEEIKEIEGMTKQIQMQSDGEYHFVENAKVASYNQALEDLRQHLQSKLDSFKGLLDK